PNTMSIAERPASIQNSCSQPVILESKRVIESSAHALNLWDPSSGSEEACAGTGPDASNKKAQSTTPDKGPIVLACFILLHINGSPCGDPALSEMPCPGRA